MTTEIPTRPAIGDPVVLWGAKYRIQAIDDKGIAHLGAAGPHWRTSETSEYSAVRMLTWDRIAGLWRRIP